MTPFAMKLSKSHLIPFRPSGAGPPLFCFPGSGGNVYVFREMVSALPEGQPVYAIDMEWLCEARQNFTVEHLAALSLDVIRTIQNEGPYYLCGFSFGGLVAYEIAVRLINEGDGAGLVALLDAPNPALLSNLSEADSAQFRKTYLVDRLKKYALQLAGGALTAFTSRRFVFVSSQAGRFFMPAIKVAFRMMNKELHDKLGPNPPAFLKA